MNRDQLRRAAAEIQRTSIVPHCPVCTKPCCKLDELVLDLAWREARALYQITKSRRDFDAALADGSGPAHIKEHAGRYYAHGAPCPAYDTETTLCRVYGTDVKPQGCTDFPVYLDGDAVTADRRCEAVDVDAVERALVAAVPRARLRRVRDAQFPEMLVSWEPEA